MKIPAPPLRLALAAALLLVLPPSLARAQAPAAASPAQAPSASSAAAPAAAAPAAPVSPAPAPTHWRLAWSSEFNGPAGSEPSPDHWSYLQGNNRGWGNHELEYYCPPTDNTAPCSSSHPNVFEDGHGHLVIQARRDASGAWTSGRMQTRGHEQVVFGRIEARMRLPVGAGIWPAFWMLGTARSWPASGEIDIMENVPLLGPHTIQSTIHAADFYGGHGLHGTYTLPDNKSIAAGFHVYGVIWTPDAIRFYVDRPSNVFVTITRPTPTASWPFGEGRSNPFFILLNLAVGGGWPGPPNASTPAVNTMLVDYVRVYQAAQ